MNKKSFEEAFSLLDLRLTQKSSPPIHLIVCGGSALLMLKLVERVTYDVDVLALWDQESSTSPLIASRPLPTLLKQEVIAVARDLGLDNNWLNDGPSDLLTHGLPIGFMKRLKLGFQEQTLSISFVSRLDQIHFKLYASVDQGPGRHVNDLLNLKPSSSEIKQASQEFLHVLKEMLQALGFPDVIQEI